jgi:glycosyltransferase involved in cell wall biosynthesis
MKISACIIAKNEEKNLPRLLRSLKGKFDEIILVDTGSKDKTVEIALKFGCKVYKHCWKGFADARNRAVKEATGDWLWHFDADFELEDEEFKKALMAMKNAPPQIEAFSIGVKNFDNEGNVKAISSHIFIHRRGIFWKGKVHESPMTNKVIGIPVFVNHYGYADPQVLKNKAHRNLKLLEEEISELKAKGDRHNYLIKLFFVVQSYVILSEGRNKDFLKKALLYSEEFLKNTQANLKTYGFFVVYIYNYYLQILWHLNMFDKLEDKLLEVFKKGLKLPEFYLLGYKYFYLQGKVKIALRLLAKSAEMLDSIVSNPFSFPYGGASECLRNFEQEIIFLRAENLEDSEFKRLKKRWLKKQGKYLGLLLLKVAPEREKEKILRKLLLRYGTL